MHRIFGALFAICFVFALIGVPILIWDFNLYNVKTELTLWFLTFVFYTFDNSMIEKYGK